MTTLSSLAAQRARSEPFAAPRAESVDETVYEFAARRMGRGFADTFVAAMVRGVPAGDAREVSLAALFPKMRKMEDEHGSLTRALIAKLRSRSGRADRPSGPSPMSEPGSWPSSSRASGS